MVTAVKEIQSAVRAVKLGAYEYIIKPFLVDDVINIINRALEKRNLMKAGHLSPKRAGTGSTFDQINRARRKNEQGLRSHLQLCGTAMGPLLIQGESGTGRNWWREPSTG